MSKMKKGSKIYVSDLRKIGKVHEMDASGQVKKAIIDNEIVDVSDKIVTLWESISWLVRFFIRLFSKKK